MSNNYQEHLENVKNKLDEVSSSFCVAKWKQVTMHLQNGMNHSCHHPKTHVVPINEIKINTTALHNSKYKKQQRKMMLEGIRPSECEYCWRVEDNGNGSYSDRIYKSAAPWALPYVDDITKSSWDTDIDPSYVEVSFSNVCNFKCSYCAPHISSQWMEEIKKHGPYPTSNRFNNLEWIKHENMMPIPIREENPYLDAFWKWWPEMYTDLHNFRITGGEPLLSKDTFRILDYIIDNPNPQLELSINSNLNPPDELIETFLEKIKVIIKEKKVKQFKLFTSAEAHGKQSEYIRFGMNYEKWLYNINKFLTEIPELSIIIMSTYNILSLPSYTKFLNDMLDIKLKYGKHDLVTAPLLIDIPYLRYPEHQSVFIMEPEMINYVYDHVTYIYKNLENKNWRATANQGFYELEAEKLKRIFNMLRNFDYNNNSIIEHRKNFIAFVDEHDRRRGTNFLETFPEFEKSYTNWKLL